MEELEEIQVRPLCRTVKVGSNLVDELKRELTEFLRSNIDVFAATIQYVGH